MDDDPRLTPMANEPNLSTTVVSAGRPRNKAGAPLNVPITPASTYMAGGIDYGRFGNPTWTAFEDILGELEGGHCLSYASGMAAISAILDLVPVGGKVVAPRHAYHGTLTMLDDREKRRLLTVDLVDIENTAEVIAATEDAALVWLESPTNPALEIADIAAIAKRTQEVGTALAVDNTFATPLRQRPLELGADFVAHSATKLIAGHSDALIGAVVTNDRRAFRALKKKRDNQGNVPGTLEAWLATRGIRTLAVRLDRAEANARELAERLSNHRSIANVRYPGFGTIISFEVRKGAEAAQQVVESSELIIYATSLGGVESMWERRRRWPSEAETIAENLIRFSVGIENVEDIWADIKQAISVAVAGA